MVDFANNTLGVPYSRSGMRDLLWELGYRYKQLELFPCRADVDKQTGFIEKYNQLEGSLKENEQILFLDAVHPQHNTHASRTWSRQGEKVYIPSNCGRQRINLNGAYNPKNQDILIREDDTINAQSTIELLKMIIEKYPEMVVYCICDNARYYRSKLVKEFLEKHPNIQFMFLPPYSPNLNLIERLWKLLKKGTVNYNFYDKYQDFRGAIFDEIQRLKEDKEQVAQFIGTKFQTYQKCNLVSV